MTVDRQEGNTAGGRHLTQARAAEILSAYGAQPSRWPEAERASLITFLEDSSPGFAMLEDARDTDGALHILTPSESASALAARVLADFDRLSANRTKTPWLDTKRIAARLRDTIWPGVPIWQPVFAFSISLIAGLAVGAVVPLELYGQSPSAPELSQLIDQPLAIDLDRGN